MVILPVQMNSDDGGHHLCQREMHSGRIAKQSSLTGVTHVLPWQSNHDGRRGDTVLVPFKELGTSPSTDRADKNRTPCICVEELSISLGKRISTSLINRVRICVTSNITQR